MPARDLIAILIADHETVSRMFRCTVNLVEQTADVVTADLLTERVQAQERTVCMLRSLVAQ